MVDPCYFVEAVAWERNCASLEVHLMRYYLMNLLVVEEMVQVAYYAEEVEAC